MLKLEGVSKTFYPGTVNEKRALNKVSLHLAPGDFATVVGSNGAGKSTLFNAISGVFYADEGSVVLGGEDVKELIIVAQDPTAYGEDWGKPGSICELLDKLNKVPGLEWRSEGAHV